MEKPVEWFVYGSSICRRTVWAVKSILSGSSISLLKKAKKICYNKWGVSPIIIHKTEVAYDTDM